MSDPVKCAVYRSKKTEEMYLFIPEKDKFDDIPEAVLKSFGMPVFSMELELAAGQQLVRAKADEIIANLKELGYHVQLPPPASETVDALLERHNITR